MKDYFQKRPAASNSDLRAQVWFLREKRAELILQSGFFAIGWKCRSLRLSVTRPRGNGSTDEFFSARKSRHFKAPYRGHRLTVPPPSDTNFNRAQTIAQRRIVSPKELGLIAEEQTGKAFG